MTPLRLMTFNLRRDVAKDGANAWPRRRMAAASLVRDAAPHLLATQEGLASQLADLDEALPHLRRVGGCRRGDGSDEHVAVFYDPRRLLLVAHGDVWLSDEPHRPGSATWGNRLPRMATWARLSDQEAGVSFTAVSTHLDHQSAGARRRSADFLAARFPDAVLLGDFNEAPGGPVHARLLGASWRDGWEAHERPGEEAPTFHGFTGRARDRIDWVLLPPALRPVAHRVVGGAPGGPYPSDHHAVLVEATATTPSPPRGLGLLRPMAETTPSPPRSLGLLRRWPKRRRRVRRARTPHATRPERTRIRQKADEGGARARRVRIGTFASGLMLLLPTVMAAPVTFTFGDGSPADAQPDLGPTNDGLTTRLSPVSGLADAAFQRDMWGDVPVHVDILRQSNSWRPISAAALLVVSVDGVPVAEVPFTSSWHAPALVAIPGEALPAGARFTLCIETKLQGVPQVSCHNAAKNRLLDAGRAAEAELLDATPSVNVMTF